LRTMAGFRSTSFRKLKLAFFDFFDFFDFFNN
jgi:hypothetical protein